MLQQNDTVNDDVRGGIGASPLQLISRKPFSFTPPGRPLGAVAASLDAPYSVGAAIGDDVSLSSGETRGSLAMALSYQDGAIAKFAMQEEKISNSIAFLDPRNTS